MSVHRDAKSITVNTLSRMKSDGEKIACLTAYDASFAALLDKAGVEVILVGDSLGMVIQGFDTTVPVTVDEMVYHTRCVSRVVQRALVIADMPFLSYCRPEQALSTAARLMQEGGAQMVKLESGTTQIATVARLSEQGVAVCAHLGLRPQSIHKLGGYRVQGKDDHSAQAMLEEALSLQDAGAEILLLECIPGLLAAEITANVELPVIGIGAGVSCDGQILVLQDILGITHGKTPRFTKNFLHGVQSIQEAIVAYVQAVKNRNYPGPEHTF